MKKSIYLATLLLMTFGLVMTSCKKSEDDDLETGTALKELSSDENNAQGESDALLADFSAVVENSFMGKVYPIKGATVNDSEFVNLKRIIINYDGDNADGSRHRSGKATIELTEGSKWTDMGAVLRITISKLMVNRKVSGKSIEFNGIFFLKNVTGGKVFSDTLVKHRLWGAGITSFDGDAGQRIWNVCRLRTFQKGVDNVITTEGDTTIDGHDHVVAWGSTRKGVSFHTSITTPVVWSSACPNGPMSGVKVHKGFTKDVTVTFGVDADGNTVTSGCPYGFKVAWKNKEDRDKQAVLEY